MDKIVEPIAGPVLNRVGNAIMDYTINGFKYITTYDRKRKEVKNLVDTLERKKNEVRIEIEKKGIEDGEEITVDARNWLKDVDELLEDEELKRITTPTDNENKKMDECCFGICHGNPCHRYRCGRLAYEKVQEMKTLSVSVPKEKTRSVSGGEVKDRISDLINHGWKSRENLKEMLVDKLLEHQVHFVGLWGPKEVGKTTMLRDIKREQRVKNSFDRIVIIRVTSNPNLMDIQDKIAKEIGGVEWKDEDKKERRAKDLESHIRLKREKMLIILDDVREKLDLDMLGTLQNQDFCMHMVVSRSSNECRIMGVKEENTFEMKQLSGIEAESFFWKKFYDLKRKSGRGDQVTTYTYISLAKKLIDNYCNGSTQAIAALAKVLVNEEITEWIKLEYELKVVKETAHERIVHKSFDQGFSGTKEKFFVLASVFPLESSIPVQELMRYAIGLDLINDVNDLSQAMSLAQDWVQDLISSSYLEEDDEEDKWTGGLGHVIVSRAARERVIKKREQAGENYLLKDISRWRRMDENSRRDIERCTNVISLASTHDHSCISGYKFGNLETLILDRSAPKGSFADDFFQGMTTLKVLVLKGMNFQQNSPSSLEKLTNLTTLHLEECHLGDITWICGLVKLVVLSLRGSLIVNKISADFMRELKKLRILDLTKCEISKDDDGGILANVLSSLSQLEGFYAYDICCSKDWAVCSSDDDNTNASSEADKHRVSIEGVNEVVEEANPHTLKVNAAYASLDELNTLNELNVLEIKVQNLNQLPNNDKFVKRLDHFHIFVGKDYADPPEPKSAKGFSRVLRFGSIEGRSEPKHKCLKALLSKAEFLSLEEMKKLKHFVQGSEKQSKSKYATSLPTYHTGEADFPNLQKLEISDCHEMQAFATTPIKAPNLTILEVDKCGKMNYIFKDNGQELQGEFPCLSEMILKKLDKLGSMSSDKPAQGEELQTFQALFNKKMTFPALKILKLIKCGQIVNLWEASFNDVRYLQTWENLKEVSIQGCNKLQSLGSLSIAAALKQLSLLEIKECPLIKEVISKEDLTPNAIDEIFPKLQKVNIDTCRNMKRFISSGKYDQVLLLPNLEEIRIQDCPKMRTFSSGPISTPKIGWLTVDPCHHKKLEIKDVNKFLEERYQLRDQKEFNIEDDVEVQKAQKSKLKRVGPICFCIGQARESDDDETNKARSEKKMVQSYKLETPMVPIPIQTQTRIENTELHKENL